MEICGVVLAAGHGTRMCSSLPKVLHPLLGRPLITYVLEAVEQAAGTKPVMVIGYNAERIQQDLGDVAHYVIQEPRLGTGHALRQTETFLRDRAGLVLVSYGDMPLIRAHTLEQIVLTQKANSGPLTMLSLIADDPRGFGRVLRDADGKVQAIVEEAQATDAQLAIRELNAGVYCFAGDWLWDALTRVPVSPKGEYYLTDAVGIAVDEGLSVQAVLLDDPQEAIGINTQIHLAEAEKQLRRRINRDWMLTGVRLIDPESTYIEPGVTIGCDTTLWPNTYLQGSSTLGESCTVGPNTIIHDTRLGNRCRVVASVLEGAVVEDDVDIGPFAHLRKGAHLDQGVHMGNFGEVKNSYLGPGVKIGHFSYIGDATIGTDVNIGAGTITCNFDGEKKNPTVIGAGAFIGSDTMLVAPVEIGAGARTGAGAVVTKDVPDDTLAVGMPARGIRKIKKRD